MRGTAVQEPALAPVTSPPLRQGRPAALPPAPAAPPVAPVPARRRRAPLLVAAALVAAAGVGLALVVGGRGSRPAALEATGTVEATEAVLGFAAAGRIAEIRVHEGDVVTAGDVLAILDTAQVMARLRQARAAVRVAAAQLSDLESGARPQELEDRRQAVSAAQRTLEQAELDLSRTRELAASDIVSRQALDAAQTARDVAQARYEQARQALELAEAGARGEQIAGARAALAAAQSAAGLVQASLPDYFVRSPFAGLVTVRAREPGESVVPGGAVVSVMNPADRWVRIYVPENRLGAVRIGERATIAIDAFPKRAFSGEVSWIAEEAEFTPRNVQTRDERVKLVYAVKVRITNDPELALKPGTPADVRLAPLQP